MHFGAETSTGQLPLTGKVPRTPMNLRYPEHLADSHIGLAALSGAHEPQFGVPMPRLHVRRNGSVHIVTARAHCGDGIGPEGSQ